MTAPWADPGIGEFKDGRGEFYDQDTYQRPGHPGQDGSGRTSPPEPAPRTSSRSPADGGKTWEANFIANLTRIKS